MPIEESPFEVDLFWDQLLDLIEHGMVVPVVSKDLLTLPDGRLFYPELARRLATQLKLGDCDNLASGSELNDVACRYMAPHQSPQQIYSALNRIAEAAIAALPGPPPALVKLAEISHFQLFVTSTFDSCVANALNQVRFGGEPRTRVLSYSTQHQNDLAVPVRVTGVPTVFHLMGRLSVAPSYAVTQWDVVEYFHALQSDSRSPRLLFDELSRCSLLILGNSFDGWLARFFLRMAKGKVGGGTADYIADPAVSSDESLVLFIRHFSRGAEIYPGGGGVIEFVDELHRRWKRRHPQDPPVPLPSSRPAETGAIFLSYARADEAAAARIADALRAANVDVFFDRDELNPGDAWELKIESKILDCSYFMPLVSRNYLEHGDGYRKAELNAALKRALRRFESESFIVPVAIDSTPHTDLSVPVELRAKQWETLEGGIPTEQFVGRIKLLFRRYMKSVTAGVN